MRGRLTMFDNIMTLLNTEPTIKGDIKSPDLVYAIDKFIESRTPVKDNPNQ